jgi:hypothetical protein
MFTIGCNELALVYNTLSPELSRQQRHSIQQYIFISSLLYGVSNG